MESLPVNEITVLEKIKEGKKEDNEMDTKEDTEKQAELSFFGFPSTLTGLIKAIYWMMLFLIFLGVGGGTMLMCFGGFRLHENNGIWNRNDTFSTDFSNWIKYLSMTTGTILNLVSFFLAGLFLKNRRKLNGSQDNNREELRSASKVFHNFFSGLELVAVISCVIFLSVYLAQGWDQAIPWIIFLVLHILTFIPSFIPDINCKKNWRGALIKYRYTFFGVVNLTTLGLVIWQHLKYPIPVFIPLILISYFLVNFVLVLELGFLKVLHTLDNIASVSLKYNV